MIHMIDTYTMIDACTMIDTNTTIDTPDLYIHYDW
jgi:hypothetical protein